MNDKELTSNDIIDIIPLSKDSEMLANKIIDETDVDRTKQLVNLFNLNQAKKNALRVLKLNGLLDKVSDEMIARFEKCPGQFNNTDLLNYLTTVQTSIDRANKALNLVDETPAIQLTQVNVNMNAPENLSKSSKDKITDAVKALLSRFENLASEEIELQDAQIINGEDNNGDQDNQQS